MQQRSLGNALVVSTLGLGCMGMSEFYGPGDESESIRTIRRALDLGVTLLDTADMYGSGENERLVGKDIHGRRAGVVLATKFGIVRTAENPSERRIDGHPAYVRAACDASSASSMSCALERGISQKGIPVMGVMFSKYWPDVGSTHFPPM